MHCEKRFRLIGLRELIQVLWGALAVLVFVWIATERPASAQVTQTVLHTFAGETTDSLHMRESPSIRTERFMGRRVRGAAPAVVADMAVARCLN